VLPKDPFLGRNARCPEPRPEEWVFGSLGFSVDSTGSDELHIPSAGVLPDDARMAIMDVARALINAHATNKDS
jgi:hypothetical protein